MRLLLAGGGTGGHLFPAVALAQRLLEQEPQSEVLFVGTAKGIEARVLPKLGLPLKTVDISGFVGKGLSGKLALLPKLWISVRQALAIFDQFQPEVVVGVGGYASGPALVAARQRRVPALIHEQNAWPGLTNRLLARLARVVCLTFPESAGAFHNVRTVVTGNPVRRGMIDCGPLPESRPQLLVFGGSRGARAINNAMLATLGKLEAWRGRLKIVHQAGDEDCERIRAGYREAGWEEVEVLPFIDDMAAAYAAAHLVLCRAGATTLAELTCCGRPAILVPYPYAAADHQAMNARALASRGAALMLSQDQLNAENLGRLLGDLLGDRQLLVDMAGMARSLGRPEAADAILEQCRALRTGTSHPATDMGNDHVR